jgi:hypothetical protein
MGKKGSNPPPPQPPPSQRGINEGTGANANPPPPATVKPPPPPTPPTKKYKNGKQMYAHGKQARLFSGQVSMYAQTSISVPRWSVIPLVSSDTGRWVSSSYPPSIQIRLIIIYTVDI